MVTCLENTDFPEEFKPKKNIFQTKKKIDRLIEEYLSFEILCDRLEDLPLQFENPQPRRWQPLDWQGINSKQVINIELDVLLAIIVGAIDTETPIRGYTQTSRQYLEPIHPKLARFVGGVVSGDGTMLELGLWEKEERQHAPALIKVYKHLTGDQPTLSPHDPKTYKPDDNPYDDLYRHGLHRVMTEYGAVSLYLWLVVHTTGTLQQVFAELLTDEINHMTKFWGFGVWLYPETSWSRLKRIFSQNSQGNSLGSLAHVFATFTRMKSVLNWSCWSWNHKLELAYTFIAIFNRLCCWSRDLSPKYLQQLFEP